jgi:hypothetical protein
VAGSLTFANMYQLGYVVGAIEPAAARMRDLFGIERFRVLRHGPEIATAHAWIGKGVMVELIEVGPGGPAYFAPYVPVEAERAVFHHHAYRVHEEAEWRRLVAAAAQLGLWHDVVSVKDGDMNVMFVDLREITGAYAEYVYLKGAMLSYYDDVPENFR